MKANDLISLAQSWEGKNEHDGSHREIIDIYNTQRPLPRGYAVKYTDDWCAVTVSALAVKLGGVGVIPTECSCPKMAAKFRSMGRWKEKGYTPRPGDVIFYDWKANHGDEDHVGIVKSVINGVITTIEGNYHNSVDTRVISVNYQYIRGFGIPDYEDAGETPKPTPKPEEDEEVYTIELFVRDIQNCTGCRIDGIAGPQTIRETPTISKNRNATCKCVLPVQRRLKALGYYKGGLDGHAGPLFDSAVKAYQKSISNPNVDGELTAGQRTWKHLLGMEG